MLLAAVGSRGAKRSIEWLAFLASWLLSVDTGESQGKYHCCLRQGYTKAPDPGAQKPLI